MLEGNNIQQIRSPPCPALYALVAGPALLKESRGSGHAWRARHRALPRRRCIEKKTADGREAWAENNLVAARRARDEKGIPRCGRYLRRRPRSLHESRPRRPGRRCNGYVTNDATVEALIQAGAEPGRSRRRYRRAFRHDGPPHRAPFAIALDEERIHQYRAFLSYAAKYASRLSTAPSAMRSARAGF
jgi:hypothetical protein